MAPTVRRTWAPAGKTPIIKQVGRSHTKVSIIGAICAKPGSRGQRTVRAYFRIYQKQNINADRCREFLRQLMRNIRGPIVVVWDRLLAHRSVKVRKFVESTNGRLALEYFPPYAPTLNPMEYGWAYLKNHAIPNQAPKTSEELFRTAKNGICTTRRRHVLRGCIEHAKLNLFS